MTQKRVYAVRGASCTKNTAADIQKNVSDLYSLLVTSNSIHSDDVISIQFTVTKDITALNPASALRKTGFASDIPLFCSLEPDMTGSMVSVIRVLITLYADKKPQPVFINGAEALRPDLQKQNLSQ